MWTSGREKPLATLSIGKPILDLAKRKEKRTVKPDHDNNGI